LCRTGENIWNFNKNTNFIGLSILMTGYLITKLFLGDRKKKKSGKKLVKKSKVGKIKDE